MFSVDAAQLEIGEGEKTFNAKIVGTDPNNERVLSQKAEKGEFTPIENG